MAYLFYLAGVFTVISMAVNYGQRLGFGQQGSVDGPDDHQFRGLSSHVLIWTARASIRTKSRDSPCLGDLRTLVSSWAVFMTDVSQFYAMAIIIGCVQGGVQGSEPLAICIANSA